MKKKAKAQLKKDLWKLFSEYIRRRDKGICITCGRQDWDSDLGEISIKGMHAGHFHHNVLDFDEVNINCQCPGCNTYRHGKLNIYAMKLIKKHGLEEFEKLSERATLALSGEIHTSDWYLNKIVYYKEQVNNLQSH